MSTKGQRREEDAREKKAGERLEDGTRRPGPSGRPPTEVRCFHCDRLLMTLPRHVVRWMIRGASTVCPKCKRETVL